MTEKTPPSAPIPFDFREMDRAITEQNGKTTRWTAALLATAALGVMSQVDGPTGAWFRSRFQEKIDFWDQAEQKWLDAKHAQWKAQDWESPDLGEFYRQIEMLTEGIGPYQGQNGASRRAERLQHEMVQRLRELYKQGASKEELAQVLVKTDLNPNEFMASMTYRTLGYGGNCVANFRFYASVWAELFPEDIRYMREDHVLIKDVATGKEVPHVRLLLDRKAFDPAQPREKHWVQLDRRQVTRTDSVPSHDEDIRKTALDELALARGWAVEANPTGAGDTPSWISQVLRVGQRNGSKRAKKIEFVDPKSGTIWEAKLDDDTALVELRKQAEERRRETSTPKADRQEDEQKIIGRRYQEELRDALTSSAHVFTEENLDPLEWMMGRGPVRVLPQSRSSVQLISGAEARTLLERGKPSPLDEHRQADLAQLERIMDEVRDLIEARRQACKKNDFKIPFERIMHDERIENGEDYFDLLRSTQQAFARLAESKGFKFYLGDVFIKEVNIKRSGGEDELEITILWRFVLSAGECTYLRPEFEKKIPTKNTDLAYKIEGKEIGTSYADALSDKLWEKIVQEYDGGNLSKMPPLNLGDIIDHRSFAPEEMAAYFAEAAVKLSEIEENMGIKFVDLADIKAVSTTQVDRTVTLAPLIISKEQIVPEALFLTPYLTVVWVESGDKGLTFNNVLAERGMRGVKRVKFTRWNGEVMEAVNDYPTSD